MRCPKCGIEMTYRGMKDGKRVFVCRNAPKGRERCPNYGREITVKAEV